MPTDLPQDALLTLAITVAAVALFIWNRLPVEVVGLIAMTTLIVSGLVSPQEGLSGFANEATAAVSVMLVLSIGFAGVFAFKYSPRPFTPARSARRTTALR